MKGYQLSATGYMRCFDKESSIVSREIYLNKESITPELMNQFKEKCCNTPLNNPKSLLDLDEQHVRINIVEVDIIS